MHNLLKLPIPFKSRVHQQLENCDKEVKMVENEDRNLQSWSEEEFSRDSRCTKVRRWVWNAMERPNDSVVGKVKKA